MESLTCEGKKKTQRDKTLRGNFVTKQRQDNAIYRSDFAYLFEPECLRSQVLIAMERPKKV